MSNPLLSARGLSKTYTLEQRPIEVLKGVDIDVNAGELVAVVGASGTGKSTLLNILGALDTATSGTVLFDGKDILKQDDRKQAAFRNRELGFVFQFGQLLPEFTAVENAAMPLCMRRDPRAIKQAEAMLDKVGLSHRLRHRPAELSGGEQQRVAIARAMVGAPRLILADEPTGNLDSQTGEGVFDMLLKLSQENGTAILMVTHNEALAARCHRTLSMKDGRLNG